MSAHLTKILPTPFQCAAVLFLTVLVMAVGNTRELLEYYSLDSSSAVIHNSAGSAINSGLSRLDDYSFIDTAVTFAIWAAVGLLCFSVIRAIARVYRDIEQDEELSSNRYVHPTTFVRSKFWKHLFGDFIGLVSGVVLTLGALFLLFSYILPASLAYTRLFLLGVSLTRVGYFCLGFALLYVWLLVVCACLRIVVYHHRIFS